MPAIQSTAQQRCNTVNVPIQSAQCLETIEGVLLPAVFIVCYCHMILQITLMTS